MDKKYDVVIIGAGIGGLVCGCYLAKAGLKVLIVEKNAQPGGYCTSFKRGNFTFDACVHSFGSCGQGEILNIILHELKLDTKIMRASPSDVIITPEQKIEINNNLSEIINQLSKYFPKERKIRQFFGLFDKNSLNLYLLLKKKTYQNLLNEYFRDYRIKAILSIFLTNFGISPHIASAFIAILSLKSFIFNGGYYPIGGMSGFADDLVRCFITHGGKISYGQEVKKIKVINNTARGVFLKRGDYLSSKIIISNIDAKRTFTILIEPNKLKIKFISQLNKLLPSSSAFIVYLGLRDLQENAFDKYIGVWQMPDDYSIENTVAFPLRDKACKNNFLFCSNPIDPTNKKNKFQVMRLIANAPFRSEIYWAKNKELFAEELINRTCVLFPNLKSHILIKEMATPQTLFRTTFNYRGSMCGWLNSIEQNENELFKNYDIKKLYLVGHWLIEKYGQGGIAMVAYSGKKMSNKILYDCN